uniref:B30.2/SPRY domain-containing protein n=1 Tax=Poecilia reticulata TaxID=8081 RepID=A0A3P9Q8N1_POERE
MRHLTKMRRSTLKLSRWQIKDVQLCRNSCSLSLDPNTAFENLLLSEENTKVTWTKKAQEYPYRTERFTKYDQVLCAEGLSGVCYWEVEWKGPRVEVAVWQSKDSCFGHNTLSWKIICSPSGCTFWHNSLHKGLIPPAQSRRVGVHLEYNEGKLSFYSVSRFGELTLLHRVQTTFRHPRPQFNDRLFRRINGSAAAYLGHSGEERCGAVH